MRKMRFCPIRDMADIKMKISIDVVLSAIRSEILIIVISAISVLIMIDVATKSCLSLFFVMPKR